MRNLISSVVLIAAGIQLCSGSHFAGGTLSWTPYNSTALKLYTRLSWIYGHLGCPSGSNNGLSSEPVTFTCSPLTCTTVYPLYCTDSTSTGTWDSGHIGEQLIGTSGSSFAYSYSGIGWIDGAAWSLIASGTYNVRTDTNEINNPPVTDMIPIVHMSRNQDHVIKIPVWDADQDIVKCRWATGTAECDTACGQFPELSLDEDTCTLTYQANAVTSNGYREVAIQIEDFIAPNTNAALSSIPLQFLVATYSIVKSVPGTPVFVDPTPTEGSVIRYFNNNLPTVLVNVTAKGTTGMTSILSVTPLGLIKSAPVIWNNSSGYYISVLLTGNLNLSSTVTNTACFIAIDSEYDASEVRCLHLQRDLGCSGISVPQNGSISTSNSSIGIIVTFSCLEGYLLNGPSAIECLSNETWNNTVPTCVIKNCSSLTVPLNGEISSNDTSYGTTASFSCKTGYSLKGNSTTECLANETWSHETPTCVINNCPDLSGQANGRISTNATDYGTTVDFSCNVGYTRNGPAATECLANKTWSNEVPSCDIKNCSDISPPVNGRMSTNDTTYGTQITFSCQTGYSLNGPTFTECLANETWSHATPKCSINNCSYLVVPLNGEISSNDTSYGTTVSFSCEAGYSLNGKSTTECLANETWSHENPTCVINNCYDISVPANGKISSNATAYGTTVDFSCNVGYTRNGPAATECLANKTWSNEVPSCDIKNCSDISPPANGKLSTNDTTYRTTITFSCQTGYTLNGPIYTECLANETWSHATPTCSINKCSALLVPHDGEISTNEITYGTTATFSCNEGYSLHGSQHTECLANETWSRGVPTCDIKNCSSLSDPSNGNISTSAVSYGTTVTFSCNKGYGLRGNTQTTCRADATWSSPVPTCIDKVDLYPYKTDGDSSFTAANSQSREITFDAGIPIADSLHTKLYVSSNGLVSFGSKFDNPTPSIDLSTFGDKVFIAPYFTHIGGGTVYYRSYDLISDHTKLESSDVKRVEDQVNTFGKTKEFITKFILFVTWKNVTPFDRPNTDLPQTATFQLVLATDGIDTFSMVIYDYGNMNWSLNPPTNIWIGLKPEKGLSNTHILSFTRHTARMDIHAKTRGISGLLFYRMTSAENRRQRTNGAIQCLDWYNNNIDKKETLTAASKVLPPCPCDLDKLTYDPWYKTIYIDTNNIQCKQVYYSKTFNTAGKSCCYNKTTGLLLKDIPYAGTLFEFHPKKFAACHVEKDSNTKRWCCEESAFCEKYYELRPIGRCYNTTTFDIATAWGDPHIRTLDGKNYTFNGQGEYWLTKTIDTAKDFEIQARTGRVILDNGTESHDATVFTAFAAKDSNATFQVELTEDSDGIILYGNGADLTEQYNGGQLEYEADDNSLIVSDISGSLHVFFPNSGIELNVMQGVRLLKLVLLLPLSLTNKTRGLLGNFNADPTDDFITPDEQLMSTNISEREIFEYGKLWEVSDSDSIFRYSPGKSHSDYQNASFIPRFLHEVEVDILDEAVRICYQRENEACVFDYSITRSESIANDTLITDIASTKQQQEIDAVVPYLSVCGVVTVTLNEKVSCLVSFDDSNSIQFIDNDVGAIYNITTSAIEYNQNMSESPKLSFVVQSSSGKRKQSPPEKIEIELCTGCNSRGKCTGKTRASAKANPKFKIIECECDPKYAGEDCEHDLDACAAKPCSLGRGCIDLAPVNHSALGVGYTCTPCPEGYIDNGTQCKDVDECIEGTAECDHTCVNIEGSYTCTCDTGYRKSLSNRSQCLDINECDEAIHSCDHICQNYIGGFNCSCYIGYIYNETTGSCLADSFTTAACERSNCSYGCIVENDVARCFCASGFELEENNSTCKDIDECERNVCSQTCENFEGGFVCGCHTGFQLENTASCVECEIPYWGNNCTNECICSGVGTQECNSVHGCVCKNGWHGDSCDEDINECETNLNACSDVRKDCVNVDGSYYCECREGYAENENGCTDVDECADPTQNECQQLCSNTNGGYICDCFDGYTKNGTFNCEDIDECASSQTNCEHLCDNYPGLYTCTCHYGFILNNDRLTCREDFNPCELYSNETLCSHICLIEDDQPRCQCNSGFTLGKDGKTCIDINECTEENPCSGDATCKNTEGTFTCSCHPGSKLENDRKTCSECDEYHYGENCMNECSCLNGVCDKITGCICNDGWAGENCDLDVDECTTGDDLCAGDNEVCLNIPHGYLCVCQDGYKNITGQCEDIDECEFPGLNTCDQVCNNIEGSYTCSCRPGFIFADNKCTDIDECTSIHDCEYHCDNTLGSYRCSCPSGFKLDLFDRQSCYVENECDEDGCDVNANCLVINGLTTCLCKKGYTGNGTVCTDIDECLAPVCHHYCSNRNGSYACECNVGFLVDSDLSSCKVCDVWSYGNECLQNCTCNKSNTDRCDNVNGSCTCNKGWRGESCDDDVDECTDNSSLCPAHSDCINKNGSFDCQCQDGYLKTGTGLCKECGKWNYGKSCAGNCACNKTNTISCDHRNGICNCSDGWEGGNCSININECMLNESICDDKAKSTCRDTLGSYECDCDEGYFELDEQCKDIDECLDKDIVITCPNTSIQNCINTNGSYNCVCKPGFFGNGIECSVCTGNSFGFNCSETCSCNKTRVTEQIQSCDLVTGVCRCNNKWIGDSCEVDVNECEKSDICQGAFKGCHNIDGDYECVCLVGYTLNDSGVCIPDNSVGGKNISGTTAIMTLVISILLPPGTNLRVAKTYEAYRRDVVDSLTKFFRVLVRGPLTVIVVAMRAGSLVVDYVVQLENETADKQSLMIAIQSLVHGANLTFRNTTVTAQLNTTITDPCAIFTNAFGQCSAGYSCKITNGPTCVKDSMNDNFKLIFGMSAGFGLALIAMIALCICLRLAFIRKQKNRENKYQQKEEASHTRKRLPRSTLSRAEVQQLRKNNDRSNRNLDSISTTGRKNSLSEWKFYYGPASVDDEKSTTWQHNGHRFSELKNNGSNMNLPRPNLQNHKPRMLQLESDNHERRQMDLNME